MSTISGLLSNYSVLGYDNGNPMLSFRYRISSIEAKARASFAYSFVPKLNSWPKVDSIQVKPVGPQFSMSRGGGNGLKFDDEYEEDPYWLYLFKETIRGLKLLVAFLVQQPGQLKYIEWPSFQDTKNNCMFVLDLRNISAYIAFDDCETNMATLDSFRTATLTLVLVAALIVALCSIDSALSYVLALLLRKSA